MQHDENPMYVFDAGFGVKAASLLQDYHVRPYRCSTPAVQSSAHTRARAHALTFQCERAHSRFSASARTHVHTLTLTLTLTHTRCPRTRCGADTRVLQGGFVLAPRRRRGRKSGAKSRRALHGGARRRRRTRRRGGRRERAQRHRPSRPEGIAHSDHCTTVCVCCSGRRCGPRALFVCLSDARGRDFQVEVKKRSSGKRPRYRWFIMGPSRRA